MVNAPYEIEALIPELKAQLGERSCAIVGAPPGSGKSTVLPLLLLEEPWLAGRKIILLQPRRIAARNVALRLAELHGSSIGETIGYRVRFESRTSARTRLEVVTEGILIRMLQDDPGLESCGLLLFDEFHERSLQADLALALSLDVQETLRPDLRVVLMSATLDVRGAQDVLRDAPIVTCNGRTFPVTVEYQREDPKGPIALAAARETATHFARHDGDILVFLPGVQQIRRAVEEVDRLLGGQPEPYTVVPLFGDLPLLEQQRAIQPRTDGRRKIIVTTPIAETSLTIEGITVVIDSGLRNTATFDPAYGLTRFQTEPITKDSAEQRAGRAGRLRPGHCVRLWSQNTQRTLRDHRVPEILGADLAPLMLELCAWGTSEPSSLRWIDAPPAPLLAHALDTLRSLGAIDKDRRLTAHGRELHRFGAHPRIGQLLLSASERGVSTLGADLAALLEERDPLALDATSCSIEDRLEALHQFRIGRSSRHESRSLLARIDRAATEWRKRLPAHTHEEVSAGGLLSLAFPDRIARRRATGSNRYLTTRGTGLQLRDGDPLASQEFIVAVEAKVGAGDAAVQLAAPLSREELERLHRGHFLKEEKLTWDDRQDAIVADRVTSLGKMPLKVERVTTIDPDRRVQLLLNALRERGGASALNWSGAALELRQRVSAARVAYPEVTLPDLSDEALTGSLDEWLAPHLTTVSRFAQLVQVDLASAVQQLMSWDQRAFVDRVAPSSIALPVGKHCRLEYASTHEAVLAATVQDLFGLFQTPRIGEGRIPVSVHLLSPAKRPVQVTRDLASFWQTTYQQVKKELKGRYPKHYWPDDPLTAPIRRPRRE